MKPCRHTRVPNIAKIRRIEEQGQTTDLPLFDGGADPPSTIPATGHDTRNEAHAQVVKKLGNDEMLVYATLVQHGPLTDLMIAKLLKWPINRVTGRRNGLLMKGRVVRRGTVHNPDTGRTNALWSAN